MSAAKDKAVKETAGGSGKWKKPGVPHKGWTCVGYNDLEEPSALCEMRETVTIRYVHYMEHPDNEDSRWVLPNGMAKAYSPLRKILRIGEKSEDVGGRMMDEDELGVVNLGLIKHGERVVEVRFHVF